MSRWRQNRWGCNHHALSTPKAKITDLSDPPRQHPPHHQIHELVAISAKFFMNDSKKTLVLASSAEEKRGVNLTSALGPLLTCMR